MPVEWSGRHSGVDRRPTARAVGGAASLNGSRRLTSFLPLTRRSVPRMKTRIDIEKEWKGLRNWRQRSQCRRVFNRPEADMRSI